MPIIRKNFMVFDVYYLPINKLPILQISQNNRRQVALLVMISKVLPKNGY